MNRKIFFLLFLLIGNGASGALAQTTYKLDGNHLILPAPIAFKNSSDKILPESEPMLDYIKAYLDTKTLVTLLRIEGHVSDAKNSEQAQILSEKRAMAIAKALVKRGADCKRILPVGFGASKPLGNDKNTRITLANAELRNRAIGGLPTDGGGKNAGTACEK